MLDPACGSMHFGLYAFDLFEVIYDEAWELEEKLGADALSRPPGMKSLHDTLSRQGAFLKDVPRLIIEHNIHGIDIDPRCAQIAGLSLWLRAQKSWQRLGLKPAERPAIKRSNIVCAEPMPGEKELLREFVEQEFPAEERGLFLRLLETIFDKMQLAGEAGSLLKIEEEIRSAIAEAKQLWKAEAEGRSRANYFPKPAQRSKRKLSSTCPASRMSNSGNGWRNGFTLRCAITPSRPKTAAASSAGSLPRTRRGASPSLISAANATTWR